MDESNFGEYTQAVYDAIWENAASDFDVFSDFEELKSIIVSSDFFRPFSLRFLAFINTYLSKEMSAEEANEYLTAAFKTHGISFNRNTLKNWLFGNTEPKYGDNDRERFFSIAFALDLSPQDTEKLFHKVLLDRAFNRRNVREFVYLFCLKNKLSYSEAESICARIAEIEPVHDEEFRGTETQFIGNTVISNPTATTEDLLQYIRHNRSEFEFRNVTAADMVNKYKSELLGSDDHPGLAEREYRKKYEIASDDHIRGYGAHSESFLIFSIRNFKKSDFDTSSRIDIRSKLPIKEIYNQFPDNHTLSLKDPSAYVLRKNLILLAFFRFWALDYVTASCYGYDDFVDETNNMLNKCGFSPLYPGNPYDWLFLYSSAAGNSDFTPLDVFRGLVGPD